MKKPDCPPDLLPLSGSVLPLHAQLPKGVGKTGGVRQAMIDGKVHTHCPACAEWVPSKPINDVPKITNQDGPTVCKCGKCGYTLATIGTPLYQTGGTVIQPSSNSKRVASRRGGVENV